MKEHLKAFAERIRLQILPNESEQAKQLGIIADELDEACFAGRISLHSKRHL